MSANGSIKDRVRGLLLDLRASPQFGDIWAAYLRDSNKESITIQNLEKAICQMENRTRFTKKEREIFSTVVLEELSKLFGGQVLCS